MDATRISDGAQVYIKQVKTDANELRILQFLNREEVRSDPRNHCVPLLDLFQDDDDPSISYVVMPFLHPFMHSPRPTFIMEAMDIIDQFLEGLVFIHGQDVAHRDCAESNLALDARALFPDGFHPVLTGFPPNLKGRMRRLPRFSSPTPLKYYFIDFGISVHIPAGQPRLVLGEDGIDQEVPELSARVPYDPFKVDIFILGNVFQHEIYARFSNVDFLRPLIRSMTRQDPTSARRCHGACTVAADSWTNFPGPACLETSTTRRGRSREEDCTRYRRNFTAGHAVREKVCPLDRAPFIRLQHAVLIPLHSLSNACAAPLNTAY